MHVGSGRLPLPALLSLSTGRRTLFGNRPCDVDGIDVEDGLASWQAWSSSSIRRCRSGDPGAPATAQMAGTWISVGEVELGRGVVMTNAWMVRAGRDGEREADALEQS